MDIERLKDDQVIQESGEDYKTYFDINSLGIVLTETGDNIGLLVEPMDFAPFVVEIGSVSQVRSLANYLVEVADQLDP